MFYRLPPPTSHLPLGVKARIDQKAQNVSKQKVWVILRQDSQPLSFTIQQRRAGPADGQPVSCTLERWAGMLSPKHPGEVQWRGEHGVEPSGLGSEDAGPPEVSLPESFQEK